MPFHDVEANMLCILNGRLGRPNLPSSSDDSSDKYRLPLALMGIGKAQVQSLDTACSSRCAWAAEAVKTS